jgi:hypothetical protein
MYMISLSRPRFPFLRCRLAAEPLPCTGGCRGWELWGVAWCGFQVGFGRLRSTAWWMDGCKGLDALGYPHSSYSIYPPLPVLCSYHYYSCCGSHTTTAVISFTCCCLYVLCWALNLWSADCSALLWMFLALPLLILSTFVSLRCALWMGSGYEMRCKRGGFCLVT